MLGVLSPAEALREAEKRGLDLVEISPKANPPVCKIMDYGKFKYEQKKKSQGQRKQQPGSIVKEVTLSPQTDEHDLNFKMKNSARFLSEGYRVKVTVKFRGREMAHPEIGQQQMKKVLAALGSHATVESEPRMEGRMLVALFAPGVAGAKPKPAPKPASTTGSAPQAQPAAKVASSPNQPAKNG